MLSEVDEQQAEQITFDQRQALQSIDVNPDEIQQESQEVRAQQHEEEEYYDEEESATEQTTNQLHAGDLFGQQPYENHDHMVQSDEQPQ